MAARQLAPPRCISSGGHPLERRNATQRSQSVWHNVTHMSCCCRCCLVGRRRRFLVASALVLNSIEIKADLSRDKPTTVSFERATSAPLISG